MFLFFHSKSSLGDSKHVFQVAWWKDTSCTKLNPALCMQTCPTKCLVRHLCRKNTVLVASVGIRKDNCVTAQKKLGLLFQPTTIQEIVCTNLFPNVIWTTVAQSPVNNCGEFWQWEGCPILSHLLLHNRLPEIIFIRRKVKLVFFGRRKLTWSFKRTNAWNEPQMHVPKIK